MYTLHKEDIDFNILEMMFKDTENKNLCCNNNLYFIIIDTTIFHISDSIALQTN